MSAPSGNNRSTSPTPPSGAAAASTASTTSQDDWRKSVPQSYRSEEVREVAKVLASLEPNTTASSKLMLAMRFEETIFQSSSSLTDYRKRLTKRLKKVQKSYKPPPKEGGGGEEDPKDAAAKAKKAEEEKESTLRTQFGTKLLFICTHAAEAIQIMREKHGRDRASFLKQHTDNAEQWAVEIGLALPHPPPPGQPVRRKRIPRDVGYLDRLKVHLEQRVDNIRSHVVKLTQPDLFIGETLVKLEGDMEERTAGTLSLATLDAIQTFQSSSSSPSTATTEEENKEEKCNVETTKLLLQKALKQIAAPPPKTRSNFATHQKALKEVAISHITKIKAASNALVSYMALDSKGKTEVYRCLKQSHDVAVESLLVLDEILGKLEKELEEEDGDGLLGEGRKKGGSKVKLEDAWNKALEYKEEKEEITDDASSTGSGSGSGIDTTQPPDVKRPRTSSTTSISSTTTTSSPLPKIVLRSQVLLAKPNRKPPSSLLSALKMKHAELVQGKTGAATFYSIQMKFGTAFEMNIYFVPLLVTIRALPSSSSSSSSTSDSQQGEKKSSNSSTFRKRIANGNLPTYTPPNRHLSHRRRCRHFHSSTTSLLPLSVLNIPGTSSTLSPIISQKLRYASSQATFVLRRIFAQVVGKCYVSKKSDFEIEISEATALLQFLGLARDTYLSDGGDDDGGGGWGEDNGGGGGSTEEGES